MLENSKVATELPWQYTCTDVSIAPTCKMAEFMQLPIRKQKEYQPRRVASMTTYRSEFRFDEENVVWMSDNFLGEYTETRGGALSTKQKMEVFCGVLVTQDSNLVLERI